LLAPYAPHIAEELWRALGHPASLAYEPWPQFDPALTVADTIEVPVQVNGKVKTRLTLPADADSVAIQAAALADAKVHEAIGGKTVKMVKVVRGPLVTIAVA
jgi:leucyl-tRNA synthetase